MSPGRHKPSTGHSTVGLSTGVTDAKAWSAAVHRTVLRVGSLFDGDSGKDARNTYLDGRRCAHAGRSISMTEMI